MKSDPKATENTALFRRVGEMLDQGKLTARDTAEIMRAVASDAACLEDYVKAIELHALLEGGMAD